MTINVSRLQKLTAVVPDGEAASTYLEDVFGAARLNSDAGDDADVTRTCVGMGDTILEFVSPINDDSQWARTLTSVGPCVLRLAYVVEDLDEAVGSLGTEGFQVHSSGPDGAVVDTMAAFGFDLQLAQGDLSLGPSADALWGSVSPMMQIEITHGEIDAARRTLHRVFGSNDVELEFAPYLVKVSDGRMEDIKHVNLGDAMLQYIQPFEEAVPWWNQLQERGSSIHNLTWFVDDMAGVERRARAQGTPDLRYFEFDYSDLFGIENMAKARPIGRILDTRSLLGFHIELSEPLSFNMNDYLFKQNPSVHFSQAAVG